MGKKGAKMQGFRAFQKSTMTLENKIMEAQKVDFREMDEMKWDLLKKIFLAIKVMDSRTSLVGNSKVMHHMLPNIIPPIDREYTLWFIRGNKTVKNNVNYEWQLMKDIISGFFIPVASDGGFQSMANIWMAQKEVFPWDTSIFKVIDNLIIGSKKI